LPWRISLRVSYSEAAKWARASDLASPRFTANVRTLIASLGAAGAIKEARDAAARLMSLEADFTLSQYERSLLPFSRRTFAPAFMAGLRAAGLPENRPDGLPATPSQAPPAGWPSGSVPIAEPVQRPLAHVGA